jgi:hypothetical protein
MSFTYVASSSDGTILAGAFYGGYISTSTDSGVNWIEQTSAGLRNWSGIAISSDGSFIAASVYGGYIYTSDDTGSTWTERTNSGQRNWNNVSVNSDGTIIAASVYNGYLYISTDNGETWEEQTSLGTGEWSSISVSSASATCFIGSTQVTMADGTNRNIKDIKRGEDILVDKASGEVMKVAKKICTHNTGKFTMIPSGLIGNTDDIICTGHHPFWINNDQNRILARNIKGAEEIELSENFYNLQFEDEGSYYVYDVKVDSISPNNKSFKLDKKLFYNPEKYNSHFVMSEDELQRNKPPMTK